MAVCVKCFLLFSSALAVLARGDDRVRYNDEHEKRWNTPPELTPEQVTGKKSAAINGRPEARFLPFSASIALNAGHDNSDALQLGAGLGGISVSQSSSFSQAGANSFGNSGSLAASQSSSFTAGLTGISASNANAFSVNHSGYGGQSNANSNSFSIGQASSSAQANAQNGQANSGSQTSSIGTTHFSSPSGGNAQVLPDGLTISQHQGTRKPVWTNIGPNHDYPGRPIHDGPILAIQEAPIVHTQKRPTIVHLGSYDSRRQESRPQLQIGQWHQNGGGGHRGHQWRPQHECGESYPSFPSSWFHGQGQGQGHDNGRLHLDLVSSNSGANSRGMVASFNFNRDGRTRDNSDFVKFPGPSQTQSIPREFVRSIPVRNKREESIASQLTLLDLLNVV